MPNDTSNFAFASPGLGRRLALVLLVLIGSIGVDRATKIWAESALANAGRTSLLGDVLRVELAENRGAFLSLGAGMPESARRVVFVVGVGVVVVVVLALALFSRKRSTHQVVALALIASGGIGNVWDRLVRGGAVIDFLNLGIGPVRTGVFNVADLAIVAGVALLVLERPRRAPVAQAP